MKTKNLERYRAWLAVQNFVNAGRQETPVDFKIKTLWIPLTSENRTASIDLNHTIDGWQGDELYGRNGNCETPYVIIEVCGHFDEFCLGAVCALVAHRVALAHRSAAFCLRDALTFRRLALIRECLHALRLDADSQ